EDFLATVTIEGDNLPEFAAMAFREAAITDFAAILVFWQEAASRPFLALYQADDILDLQYGIVGGRKGLIYARLRDDADTIRELSIVNGAAQVVMHTRDGTVWTASEPVIISMGNRPLTSLPLFVRGDSTTTSLLDPVAVTAVKHYQLQARHYDGLAWTTTPRVVMIGAEREVDANGNEIPLSMAPGAVWWLPASENGKSADAKIIQASAELPGVRAELDRLEAHMAALGSRILAGEKAGVEAADTVAMRHSGENASLAGVARSVSTWLEKAINLMLEWAGLDTVEFALNTDFIPAPWTDSEVATLATDVRESRLSLESYHNMMVDGGWRDPSVSWEEERSRLEGEANILPPYDPAVEPVAQVE
ncbi:DUF4055 domain-containing protein, partial [Sphingobium yanoikuyae]|uniref:DUF4055 domain-containing protein n=1 Tax=Sphingobium yanoikuyae TaxID=13690 RepID=UPI0035C7A548